MRVERWIGTAMAGCLAAAVSADVTSTFLLEWSGASFGNDARATGIITFADGFPGNPQGQVIYAVGVQVTSIEMTITGANAGNGSYDTADFSSVFWSTAGATLDLSTELVGQSTPGGPWGIAGLGGANGEFNLFPVGNGLPMGAAPFVIRATSGLSADLLALTSFRPVPAPGAATILALAGFAGQRRRR